MISRTLESRLWRSRAWVHQRRAKCLSATLVATALSIFVGSSPADLEAQEEEGEREETVYSLDELVVTATRNEQSLAEIPASVLVITRAEMSRSAATSVGDFLRFVPGFTTLRQWSTAVAQPTTQAVSLRGLGGVAASRTLVLLDGIPANDPYGGWVYWNRFPLDLVERIEVVRGGSAGAWGNRALGGVINIITIAPSETGAQATVQGGSLQTVRGSGVVTVGGRGARALVSGEYFDTDGYSPTLGALQGAIDTVADTQHESFFGKAEIEVSPSLQLNFGGSYFNERRQNATVVRKNSSRIGTVRSGARYVTPGGSVWSLTGFASFQNFRNSASSTARDRSSETLVLDTFDTPVNVFGANLQWSGAPSGGHQPTLGVDFQRLEAEVYDHFLFAGGVPTRERVVGGKQILGGLYAEDVLAPGERWQFVGVARLDLWRNYAGTLVVTDLETGETRQDETFDDRTEWRFTGSLGARYRSSDRLSWRGNVYVGNRAPTLNELYIGFRAPGNVTVEANADLAPERAFGVELGADYAVSNRMLAQVSAFWTRVSDGIFDQTVATTGSEGGVIDPCGFVGPNGVCRQRQNVGRFRSLGLEADLDYRAHPMWAFAAAYIFNPTEVLEVEGRPELEGKTVRRIPEHQLTLQVNHVNSPVADVAVSGRYTSHAFDDDLNKGRIEDAFIVDLRATRPINRHWSVFVGVQNLFDTTYEVGHSASGFIRVGSPRIIQMGLRTAF